ncbi:phytoene desaturase family protein [Lactiplantibacillus paraplantarum]|uniref:phytoene desaturase family protein n=1 Tax=Lactiplantibacillus paraplantarum TaxID=60520 RepID=UPI000513628D|nr:phytoene desaturase family protein [Lactiplantibacillus paraplantarum]ALO05224.1 dehydrosqualene desaturase [Lactiplantibacillus paraplantarum]KGE75661.1 dehydrosqualene desaturase [Lactiplantibacillus paraplantarum]MCT4456304.1 phytoene desaturase [Lactiplantibacillus paraplantarum]MCW1911451.1 phytoene desaturase family protein [Lactiplantibacillus paraplantarum]RDG12433.1 phytoene desaturase [Lactiplantibacillus paraplantarum]
MKTVSVIGAGIGGLAAAVRLQKLGYDVTIYEQGAQPGGKMNQIISQGFTFDVGPTIVMMKDIYEEIFQFCGVDPHAYLPFEEVEPLMHLVFGDQSSLNLSRDLPTLIAEITRVAPDDVDGMLGFLADIYHRYAIAKPNFLERSFRSWRDFYNLPSLYAGLQLRTFNNAYQNISKFIKNENLRNSLAFQTLYIGISPYQGPSLYNIIPMIELFYGVHFLKGGMYTVVKSLVKLFKEQGGTLKLATPVKEIIIKDQVTIGIRLAHQTILSDYVVCDADFPTAMTTLIPNEQARGKYTDKKINQMTYSCSCFVLYLGLNKKYPTEALHTIHFAKDFNQNVAALFEQGTLPADPSYYVYLPSKMDPKLAPVNCESLYILVPVPELSKFNDWSPTTIQHYRQLIIDKLKQTAPFSDLEQHIVLEKQFTPVDFKEQFGAYNGATFGLRPTLKQSNYYRPHNKFDYADHLYFCGSSTHPGAGVPIVMQSAKLAVEELIKDDPDQP